MTMRADVIAFPGTVPAEKQVRAPSVVSYELDQLAEISEAVALAQLETSTAIRWVRSGRVMNEDNAALNGETMLTLLNAVATLGRLMGSRSQDADLLEAVGRWIEMRETQG